MAQSASTMSRTRVLGEYHVGRQIGSGSFSLVWHGRHRVHGTEVAIKEIVTGRLNKKLQESLLSEIFILKKINHPNIIRLHDIIEVPGRIHLVLEYCRGGDLSVYINRHGKVPEATAKLFMRQLAAGLQVLRDNNLIHRDLKPQNLLLSANDSNSVLKIADFGFARSLQPRGLAETLCGSPLYMAPEIMQLQKYDAKADLWSVGAILYQLVNGKTPFTGNNQIQLLQNIIKATELRFPPDNRDLSAECRDLCQKLLRRNPVERLTFEEFFSHPFLALAKPAEHLRSKRLSVAVDGIASSDSNCSRNIEESSQDDYMPFFLDDDSSGPDGSPSNLGRKSSTKSTYGSLDSNNNRRSSNIFNNMKLPSKYGASSPQRCEGFGLKLDSYRSSDENLKEPIKSTDRRPPNFQSRASTVADSLESIDREYVFVSGPPLDMSSSSTSASKPNPSQCITESLLPSFNKNTKASDPMPIVGSTVDKACCIGGVESPNSPPSGTSQGSMDMIDTLEQPSGHCMTRIKSLQQCASDIMDLVNEKMEAGKKLEAFSIQLVILAIWKQALHICHTQAASAMEGSPSQETSRFKGGMSKQGASDMQECIDSVNAQRPEDLCSEIEREFLLQVGHAEELAKFIEPGSNEMPDAMETIFQSALTLGRYGAVDELMSSVESAESLYSKAVRLLMFLLVEAPSLILNPPFSLTNSDRYRLRNYIDILIRQARKVSKDGASQV